jgi:putative chitinase
MNPQLVQSQLQRYRNQAAQLLERLVPAIASNSLTPQDGQVDDVLRVLGGQPPRPENRQPYSGFFPNLPLAEQRRRAAAGLKVFIERLTNPQATSQDNQIDDLIRTLRGLPPRPGGAPPYVALFSPVSPTPTVTPAQLRRWRSEAVIELGRLIPAIASAELTPADGLVDTLLRSLGGQAPRPPERQPYEGFFPNLTILEQRRRAATGIAPFIERLDPNRYITQDGAIDTVLRALRGLPARPADQPPYANLWSPSWEALPAPSEAQLNAWRAAAAQALAALVPQIPGTAITAQDGVVDDLLRIVGGQVARPSGQPPYAGLFPNLPLSEQRRRAAQGLQTFISRLAGGLSARDAAVDDALRSLRSLPPRPSDRRPYEGLFPPQGSGQPISAEQLRVWRRDAGQVLANLVPRIAGSTPTAADGRVDDLLRILGNQAARPSDRPPYSGFFPNLALTEQRRRAAQGLQVFINALANPGYVLADGRIDDLIRSLRGLPNRPEDRRPYEGLFPTLPQLPANLQITEQQLRAIAPFGRDAQIRKFVPHLNRTMAEFGINTRLRQAHFLAQLAHESGEFNYVEEIASGDAYEGRPDLGNTQPGDGRRFKGRGLIQITGRANYTEASRALGVDLVNNPTLLATDELASRSAGWFWQKSGLNAIADQDDVVRVTRIINGGTNGLSDRTQKLAAAKRVFGI